MEIGGKDFHLEGPVHPDDLDVMRRTAKAFWSECFIEEDTTVDVAFFILKNRDISADIDKHGVTEENSGFIVTVLVEEDCLSFVSDDREDSESHRLVVDILTNIRQNRRAFLRE